MKKDILLIERIDQDEARVEFDGSIMISYENKSAFVKDFEKLVEEYAI